MLSLNRDGGSKLCREEGVLEGQRSAVEMSGWQPRRCLVLPEVPEPVWAWLSCSVGKYLLKSWWGKKELWKVKTTLNTSCLSCQVKYFTKRREFLKYKARMETEGFSPAEGPRQPSWCTEHRPSLGEMTDFQLDCDQDTGRVTELFPLVTNIIYLNFGFKHCTWWESLLERLSLNHIENRKHPDYPAGLRCFLIKNS